ncbi:TonB family protein [Arenicella sp.]|nr:TonB family protein [Arenicella sp.]
MTDNKDLLSVTAFFSALLHAVIILGISFKLPDIQSVNNTDNTLDVVLINTANNEEPVEADTVSTNNNAGGGNDDQEAASPIPFEAVKPSEVQSIKKTANQQATNVISPEQYITAERGELALEKKTNQEEKLKSQAEAVGSDELTTKSQRQLERERLIAKLSQSFEDYQKRPNKQFLSPNTTQHKAARYLDDWRKKIEVTGNANYPIKAKAEGMYGTLILTVEINRNGTIADIQINNPSPHKLLNDTAMRFVRDASPYDTFPDDIDKDVDILVITRAFHFLKNNQLTSSNVTNP